MRILADDLVLGDMATDITGEPVSIEHLSLLTLFLLYTDAPVGSLVVQTAPTLYGPWFDVDTTAVSASGTKRVVLTNIGDHFLRVKYTFTSGTGTLSGFINAKGV